MRFEEDSVYVCKFYVYLVRIEKLYSCVFVHSYIVINRGNFYIKTFYKE